MPPVVMADDAFAITGQVERGAALPVGTKHRAKPPALAARPARGGQDRVLLGIPRPAGRRLLPVVPGKGVILGTAILPDRFEGGFRVGLGGVAIKRACDIQRISS